MKEKITRFIEDTFYTALIHIRNVLERLHVLHPPSAEKVQRDIEKMMAEF